MWNVYNALILSFDTWGRCTWKRERLSRKKPVQMLPHFLFHVIKNEQIKNLVKKRFCGSEPLDDKLLLWEKIDVGSGTVADTLDAFRRHLQDVLDRQRVLLQEFQDLRVAFGTEQRSNEAQRMLGFS